MSIIQIRDLEEYMRRLGSAFEPAILQGLTATAVRSVATLATETNNKRVRDTGRFLQGWGHSPAMSLGGANATVRVFNDAPYSGVIELGRRSGRKMPWVRGHAVTTQPIYLWCIRQLGMTAADAERAAWGIAASIKRKGIKGKFIVRDVKDKLAEDGAKEISKALRRALRQLPP
jgi:hypothetical protein